MKPRVKIEVKDLHKTLGNKVVLNGMDLSVFEGETFVLLGQSGVGKSVLLKHLIGLMAADDGHIFIDGEEVTYATEEQWSSLRKHISFLFQGGALFDSLTVGQNLLFALDRLSPELTQIEKEEKIYQALMNVGLPGLEDVMPSELSGGMMKRAALARAVVTEPTMVLFDEPTTGLDPVMTANIGRLIQDVKRTMRTTFLVVTHDMNSARDVSDRVAMMYKGKIIFLGTFSEIERTKDPFVHQFIRGLSEGPITDAYNAELYDAHSQLLAKHELHSESKVFQGR